MLVEYVGGVRKYPKIAVLDDDDGTKTHFAVFPVTKKVLLIFQLNT